jgi:putative FmdB family regulatory protein
MPLYEYLCETCGKKFEVLQKFADAPLTIHEDCGGKVERLLSAPAFHLKGTGWYATDYAKSGTPAPAKGEDSKSSDSKPNDSKDSESKSSDSKSSDSKSGDSKSSGTDAKSDSKTESSTPAPTTPSA